MEIRPVIIPYDVSMQYIQGRMKRIFHDAADWGNEIVIIFEGNGRYRVNETEFSISQGDIFVLHGDYTKEIPKADRMRMCSIYYRDEHIQRLAGTFRCLEGYQKLFIENALAAAYEPEDRLLADADLLEELFALVDRMIREQKLMEPGFEQVLNSSFFILITLISRAFAAGENCNPASVRDSFAKAVAYMQGNYHQELKISDLAVIAHVSERQFNRRFKEKYAMPPSQYLLGLRLGRARVLLEESGLPVTEVALECGFGDVNYFSTCFRKACGMTPTAYRRTWVEGRKMSDLKRRRPKKDKI